MRATLYFSGALILAATLLGTEASGGVSTRTYDPRAIRLLDRLTFGVTAAEAGRFEAMGLQRWLDFELHPPAADDLPILAQREVDALPLSRQPMAALVADFATKRKALKEITDPDLKTAAVHAFQQEFTDVAKQAAAREILRDLYSPYQLREVMTWFWLNHFNVFQFKGNIRATIADYEDKAIRPHALGRFRDLLEATLRHPAMLRYLDNFQNAAGHINENYAREIMELHTMGVGSGYTQQDVEALARILTGVGIDANLDGPHLRPELQGELVRDGLFEFNPARHDYGDKVFLGTKIGGRGFAEVEEALDLVARSPATARHISRELATYFVADDPPQRLIDKMGETFLHSDGDIAAVLRCMIEAPEFDAHPAKFKDPLRYVLSAVRLAYDDKMILNTVPIQNWLNRMGENLYQHEAPDGYPMISSSWDGPGQLAVRFEIARQIGWGSAGLFKPDSPGGGDHPAFPQLENALYFDGLEQMLRPSTRAALAEAQSPQEWNALFLSSPDFMR